MKNAPSIDSESSGNVIKISFGEDAPEKAHGKIPNDVAFPASKNYPERLTGELEDELEDDPLAQLLAECDIEDEPFQEETYIHAHSKPWDFHASFEDEPSVLAANVLKQIGRLKEDSKRLKYYLDELNID